MKTEKWKYIRGYNKKYKVSNLGRILNCYSRKFLSIRILSNGYRAVTLYDGKNKHGVTKKLSRIIAIEFLSNINNYPEVNHIDGNKLNDTIINLEWCTRKHNIHHAVKMGLFTNYKLTKKDIINIRKERKMGISYAKIACKYSVVYNTIKSIIKGNTWQKVF